MKKLMVKFNAKEIRERYNKVVVIGNESEVLILLPKTKGIGTEYFNYTEYFDYTDLASGNGWDLRAVEAGDIYWSIKVGDKCIVSNTVNCAFIPRVFAGFSGDLNLPFKISNSYYKESNWGFIAPTPELTEKEKRILELEKEIKQLKIGK